MKLNLSFIAIAVVVVVVVVAVVAAAKGDFFEHPFCWFLLELDCGRVQSP